ncbi:MAG: hypothetical protein LBH90_05005 [Tannerella sp.]|nr:hypothetical protein [Tannerella sp.]
MYNDVYVNTGHIRQCHFQLLHQLLQILRETATTAHAVFSLGICVATTFTT